MSKELGTFEGKDVAAIKIIITKAGDGLSAAMDVEPKVLHQGDQGYLVLAYKASKIRFDPEKVKKGEESKAVYRVQILEATDATFVDADLVGSVVDEMRDRIAEFREKERVAKEEAKGVFQFGPSDDGEG